jgi:hypothetical protein
VVPGGFGRQSDTPLPQSNKTDGGGRMATYHTAFGSLGKYEGLKAFHRLMIRHGENWRQTFINMSSSNSRFAVPRFCISSVSSVFSVVQRFLD